ncbi:integrase family protein [Pseudomonas aeruginosa]|uniref:tyrosine-type recombinase/integrase n=1 Tax=Pseudomonas aeruginosa TaxID=287 RepID=UPI001F4A74ED|nr:tyrosine-type recombinase/integrase [Pseudomonas aeruginosa]EKY4159708.1 integrase family protein [Pseudomonas aeruginosa]HBO1398279.1 integrase family protein [Pseudomonas aeruginosa]HBO1797919.1 integrase family protein [Pseudomonas aeruginosa]HEJ3287445.1 integrase family protein [Pseudomonas aeruginosa]
MKSKITQSLVERAPAPERGKSSLYADSEMRGFYLIVTPTKRSFYVQSLVNGKQVRTKLGDHPAMDAKQARDAARKTLVEMRGGANPNEERRKARARGITLRGALDLHLAAKPLSQRTKDDYRYNCEQYLADWLDKPLAELGADRAAVRERHRKITEKHGAPSADSVFRVLRAVYNRGLREHPDLPPNPTTNVDYHGLRRRKVDVDAERLLAWGKAVLGLNPVRRDLHLFMILTGMRRTSVCEARASELDLGARRLHVPKPKGGAARAFDLPLSGPLADLLGHRLAENPKLHRKSPWLFPADSKSGHVAEVAQHELDGLTGHALRHTYATLALQAGVPIAELKFLLNHAASSVTMGYLNPTLDHLRGYQEKASAYVLGAIGLEWTEGQWPPRLKQSESADNSAEEAPSINELAPA